MLFVFLAGSKVGLWRGSCYLTQRSQNHRTQAQTDDEHAQTQRCDGGIAPEFLHHLPVGAGVERAGARDAQARARNNEDDDPFAHRGQAFGAPGILVATELDFKAWRSLVLALLQRLLDIVWVGHRRGSSILLGWREASGSVVRVHLGYIVANQSGRRGAAGHGFCGVERSMLDVTEKKLEMKSLRWLLVVVWWILRLLP